MAQKSNQGFSLKDQLFNGDSIGDLAGEFGAGVPGFDAAAYRARVLSGLAERGLLECLEWMADCLEPYLSEDFPEMADQLEAAMPSALDPGLSDDDFGRFIHALPGILAVRHGLEQHRERALALLYAATQRFSMEFYIRPFLNRWPEQTLARLAIWASDENYHVRRLVSEGTRPRLPWARNVDLSHDQRLPLLDALYGDQTRYVTRSVANHLNDISKSDPELVLARLAAWQSAGAQAKPELAWMARHALRSLIKAGHGGALNALGYRDDAEMRADLRLGSSRVVIGETLEISADIHAPGPMPVMVDYIIEFHRPNGRSGRKVFKLKQGRTGADGTLAVRKSHRLKGNATTFTLHPGPHRVALQVNGRILSEVAFELVG